MPATETDDLDVFDPETFAFRAAHAPHKAPETDRLQRDVAHAEWLVAQGIRAADPADAALRASAAQRKVA